MRELLLLITLLINGFILIAQDFQSTFASNEYHKVYLMGNLIDLENHESFYNSLFKDIDLNEYSFSIIVLGDIAGVDNEKAIDQLKSLMLKTKKYSNGKLLVLPGDRDYNDSGYKGYEKVMELEHTLKEYAFNNNIPNFKWLLKKSCPGPADYSLDKHIEVIAINSQWWNHQYDKPMPADGVCKYTRQTDIAEELNDLIDDSKNKNLLILGHHPVLSQGNYGGRFSFVEQFKPLPVYGSFKNAFAQNVGGKYDINNNDMIPFQNLIKNAVNTHHGIIYATAHEKNQQIIKEENNFYINSGAIENPSYAAKKFNSFYYNSIFSAKKAGIIKIKYYLNGNVDSEFLEFQNDKLDVVYDQQLFVSACDINNINNPIDPNLAYVPCIIENVSDKAITKDFNEVIMIDANKKYDKSGFIQFLMGKHYRKDWATPIQSSYLNIDTTFNGLTVTKKGGGRQTLSLKFQSETGNIFTFRSVDKDPSKALDFKLRETFVSTIFKDQTSAQQPYGALIVADMLKHLDILHATPKLYVMPNTKALGPFQNVYGGMLGMLEESPGKKNFKGAYFADADDILKSNELFREMYENKSHSVNTSEFVRARLFDILVGDWSKHEDNWKWAAFKEDDEVIYRPIPRDRDMVMSKWDGLIPNIADMPFGLQNVEGFEAEIKGFKSLVHQARHMDRFLLTEVPREEYLIQAEYIQNNINETDIINAVKKLPGEIYQNSGEEIIYNLIQRKKDLIKYAINYFEWLNEEVEVLGSVESDNFSIQSLENGDLKIKVIANHQHNNEDHVYFERIFKSDETKEIRIYGLGNDDSFNFLNSFNSEINLILIGGDGDDHYISKDENTKLVDIYELGAFKQEENNRFNFKNHWNKDIYEYDRDRLKFNTWLPSVSLGFDSFLGLNISFGNSWTRHKWNKKDYSSKHTIKGNLSWHGDGGFSYNGIFKEAIKQWDFTTDLILANPEYFNAFYGLGNETEIDNKLDREGYYVAYFNQYILSAGLSRDFWQRSNFYARTGIGFFNSSPIENSILLDSLYKGADGTIKALPTSVGLKMDFRDHHVFPSRGMQLKFENKNYIEINGEDKNYGKVSGSVEYYISNYSKKKITLGLKVAAIKGYGNIPYYHQSDLGGLSGLRGFTRNRFKGESLTYFNSELRFDLIDKKEVSIPYRFGVYGFYDIGRVFHQGEIESRNIGYHDGYGFGLYYIPFSRSFTLNLCFSFSDENSFYPIFGIGTLLN